MELKHTRESKNPPVMMSCKTGVDLQRGFILGAFPLGAELRDKIFRTLTKTCIAASHKCRANLARNAAEGCKSVACLNVFQHLILSKVPGA